MAITALSTIKSWFLTGLKPTQGQFHNTWDSFWHKLESIPIESVDGLEETIDNLEQSSGPVEISLTENGEYVIPAGKLLEYLIVKSIDNQNVTIGTTSGGGEIVDLVAYGAGEHQVYDLLLYADNETTIYFTIATEIVVKIYIR